MSFWVSRPTPGPQAEPPRVVLFSSPLTVVRRIRHSKRVTPQEQAKLLGAEFRDARRAAGYRSQKALAQKAGYSQQIYQRIEAGEIHGSDALLEALQALGYRITITPLVKERKRRGKARR